MVDEDRGSSAFLGALVHGVAMLAVGWRRRKKYRKRGKWTSGIYLMVSTCSLPDDGPEAKFKRHSADGRRTKDYTARRPWVFALYHLIMPKVDTLP